MSKLIVFTGDDWEIPITLKKNGVAFPVDTAAEIKATVTDSDGKNPQILVPETILSPTANGADWSNGIVIAEFSAINTVNLNTNVAYVEVQVTFTKKTTWPRIQIEIKKGTIA